MTRNSLLGLVRNAATSRQDAFVFWRFLIVGFSFTLLYSVLSSALAVLAGASPPIAGAIGYLLCIPLAYLSQRNIAFRTNSRHRLAFPRYVALQAPLLLLGSGLSWVAIGVLRLPEALGFFAVGVAVALVSFVAQRLWTFSERTRPPPDEGS